MQGDRWTPLIGWQRFRGLRRCIARCLDAGPPALVAGGRTRWGCAATDSGAFRVPGGTAGRWYGLLRPRARGFVARRAVRRRCRRCWAGRRRCRCRWADRRRCRCRWADRRRCRRCRAGRWRCETLRRRGGLRRPGRRGLLTGLFPASAPQIGGIARVAHPVKFTHRGCGDPETPPPVWPTQRDAARRRQSPTVGGCPATRAAADHPSPTAESAWSPTRCSAARSGWNSQSSA